MYEAAQPRKTLERRAKIKEKVNPLTCTTSSLLWIKLTTIGRNASYLRRKKQDTFDLKQPPPKKHPGIPTTPDKQSNIQVLTPLKTRSCPTPVRPVLAQPHSLHQDPRELTQAISAPYLHLPSPFYNMPGIRRLALTLPLFRWKQRASCPLPPALHIAPPLPRPLPCEQETPPAPCRILHTLFPVVS